MTDQLATLLDELEDDTRNVLLTLTRIWATMVTGRILSKAEAAAWAIDRRALEDRAVFA
jgi:streptomycin 3"-adenylyltransferase